MVLFATRVVIHAHTIVLYLIPMMAHYLTSGLEDDSGDEDFDDANEGEDEEEYKNTLEQNKYNYVQKQLFN